MEITIQSKSNGGIRMAEQIVRLHLGGKYTNVPLCDLDEVLTIHVEETGKEYTRQLIETITRIKPAEALIIRLYTPRTEKLAALITQAYRDAVGHKALVIWVHPDR